ncbi:lipopolysaccharide biosynthesis protein [Leifsonia shinshuensis]|uniref:lipopolysaccharide biosynthesis protein n=1 Tax=Leifsonia shinshuensis TaxID=150026 RepID=UPI0016261E78|nr:lipopolysaccharide biosynthesis protein [Leifsonia shinshuensis]
MSQSTGMADTEPTLRSRAARGAAWSGVSTIVLRLGGLVVGIVLARLLAPEQFGAYAVALTVQGILITVADLGLSADLIRSDEPDRIAPTVATLGLTAGTITMLATMASSSGLASLLGSPQAGPAIAVLSVTLFLAGGTVVPIAMLQRRFQQRELFFVGVADFVVSTTVTLVLVALGFGVMGLALGRVAAQCVSSTMQFLLARVKPHYSIDRTVVRGVLAFGLPVAGANLLSWTLLNVDNIVLARVAGATALGYYVLAFNISSWPMSALSQVVRSISLPFFARSRGGSHAFSVVAAVAWAGALPAGAVLAALSFPLIDVLYGERWLPGAPVLAALGLYGSLRVAFDISAGYLYSQGRSRPVLWIQIVWLVALVGVMIVATRAFGIEGAGWAHVLVAVVVILPAYLIALKLAGIRLGELAHAAWLPTVAALPAVAAAIAAAVFIQNPLLALLAGGGAALVLYAALVWPWLRKQLKVLRAPSVRTEGAS